MTNNNTVPFSLIRSTVAASVSRSVAQGGGERSHGLVVRQFLVCVALFFFVLIRIYMIWCWLWMNERTSQWLLSLYRAGAACAQWETRRSDKNQQYY